MKTAAFLDKYDTIIFDMDGVITSEQNYWTVAALNAWEWIYNDESLSPEELIDKACEIRSKVMCNDRLIGVLKNKGVNSNWDLCYIIYAMSRILGTDDFEKILTACEGFNDNILDEYPLIAKSLSEITLEESSRNSDLWNRLMMTYQAFYLGDELFEMTYKKEPHRKGYSGFIHSEKPIIDNIQTAFKKRKKTCNGNGQTVGRADNAY